MLDTITIRRAKPCDRAAFARSMMAAAVDGLLDLEPDVTVAMVEDAFTEGSGDLDRDILVAECGGGLVGALVGHPEAQRGVRSFGMWVDSGLRRQGIGRRLVAAGLASRPTRTFEVDVWPDNEPAIRLYASFGFRPIRLLGKSRRRRDGTSSDVLRMRLASGRTAHAAK
jgi:ribosomal protein S18 acetylase RimI-like enzyme